nr:hypothetical protein [Tanacetum cinerariifolium]
EIVYKEWYEKMERVDTTASSIEAYQDSGNINRTQSIATLNEPLPRGTISGSGPRSQVTILGQTAVANTLDNREIQITATINGNVKLIFEASIRRHLKLEDSDCISTLPNTKIFKQLALMGRRRTVSTASRIISTAEEIVSTAGVSMPVSTAAKRNKPMTQAQQRTYMSNYIKHIGSYTLKQLKKPPFEEIKELFEATMRRIQDFVPMEREGDKEVSKFAGAGGSKRDVEEELDQGGSKKQKTDEALGSYQEQPVKEEKELSQEDLQQLMIIAPKHGMNVEALQVKYPIID